MPNSIVPREPQPQYVQSQVVPVAEGEPAAPSLSLRDFLQILRRRKAIALNTFVLVVILGVVLTLITKPVFQTKARMMVEGASQTVSITNSDDPLSNVFAAKSSQPVETQIELLRSSAVLDKVYKEAPATAGAVSLDVKRVGDTNIIDLTATSGSKAAAETFIRVLPDVYERGAREDRLREVKAALNFARDNLSNETEKLRNTELALQQFKNREGVVNPQAESSTALESAASSRNDLSLAQSQASALQAQLNTLVSQARALPPLIETPTTTTNQAVSVLRDRLSDLRAERGRALFRYKAGEPEIRQFDEQIVELERRIANTPSETTTITRQPNPAVSVTANRIADVRVQLDAAQATLRAARARVSQQTRGLSRFNTIERQQAQLQRDLQNSTGAVSTLTASVTQLALREKALEAQGSPVTTIQAGGPAAQVLPKPARNLVLALALGVLLACAAALLQESLDDHVRDEDEARRLLNTSVLGYFPQLANVKGRPVLDLAKPNRALLEGFRLLRSNVQFTMVNTPGQKMLVTSSIPGEGKSYVSSNLAISMALDGRRVILVDADLYRPCQQEVFGARQQPGLTNVLVGQAKLEEALQQTSVPGLRILCAGVLPPNPTELLNSPAMDALIAQLQKDADVLIFDSPPLLAAADSQVLASKVDGVLYVMNMGRVPRSAVNRSFDLLKQARAHVIGVVFNKIADQQRGIYAGGYGNYYYSVKSPDGTTSGGFDTILGPTTEGHNGTNGTANGAHGTDASGLQTATKTAPRAAALPTSHANGANHDPEA